MVDPTLIAAVSDAGQPRDRARFNARKLDEGDLLPNARLMGATPLWEWVGDGATVFSY